MAAKVSVVKQAGEHLQMSAMNVMLMDYTPLEFTFMTNIFTHQGPPLQPEMEQPQASEPFKKEST